MTLIREISPLLWVDLDESTFPAEVGWVQTEPSPEETARRSSMRPAWVGWVTFDISESNQGTSQGVAVHELPLVTGTTSPIELSSDVIFTDERPRSISSLSCQIVEGFAAKQLGLSSTESKQTFGFFNENLVMENNHGEPWLRKDPILEFMRVDGRPNYARVRAVDSCHSTSPGGSKQGSTKNQVCSQDVPIRQVLERFGSVKRKGTARWSIPCRSVLSAVRIDYPRNLGKSRGLVWHLKEVVRYDWLSTTGDTL
jgi:hypothetical protein